MVKNEQIGRLGRRRNGFTLVEVLVTVIVLAIGILGLAGLQLAGMRSNYSAYQRTQAILAANDLIDRMRVDPAPFTNKTYTSATDSQVDAFDDWADSVAALLPKPASSDPQAAVNCLTGETCDKDGTCKSNSGCGDGNCAIVIRWNDARAEDSDTVAQTGREPSSLSYRVCVRLPETP